MRRIRRHKDTHVFSLSPEEKDVLFDLVRLYPLSPTDHYRISAFAADDETDGDQSLLNDALEEQRRAHRKKIQQVFGSDAHHPCWESAEDGRVLLSLIDEDIEWLLQVLNDIRVGSWYSLGCPEDESEPNAPSSAVESYHFRWAMDACCYFQTVLIQAQD